MTQGREPLLIYEYLSLEINALPSRIKQTAFQMYISSRSLSGGDAITHERGEEKFDGSTSPTELQGRLLIQEERMERVGDILDPILQLFKLRSRQ